MKFEQSLQKTMNATARTENGAVSNLTTNSSLLDLFSQIGALRTGSGARSRIAQFDRAVSEDNLLALKILFHARDIRGGSQERETFRIFYKHLATTRPEMAAKNLHLIPEYGRWDDLWCLLDTSLKSQVIGLIKNQLISDAKSEKPSLMAKWLPSENTSSNATCKLATLIRKELGLSSRDYRKVLSNLRSKINIVEKSMSQRKWDKIVYEHVPSRASMKYRKAFKKHDGKRYDAFLTAVMNGEKKIHAGALFPYEIVEKVLTTGQNETLEALWKNLPNYFGENADDSLVVADVSGSMYGTPLYVSISLAMYMAERNKGIWNGKFITFSSDPTFNMVTGKTLFDKVTSLSRAQWGMSTDIEKVFDMILKAAKDAKLSNDEIVKKIFIISDMEFNAARGHRSDHKTLFRTISDKYQKAGYTLPTLVFWNVRSAREQFPMSLDDTNFQMVSGCSPSILQYMFTNKNESAYEKMMTVLSSERYSAITL